MRCGKYGVLFIVFIWDKYEVAMTSKKHGGPVVWSGGLYEMFWTIYYLEGESLQSEGPYANKLGIRQEVGIEPDSLNHQC